MIEAAWSILNSYFMSIYILLKKMPRLMITCDTKNTITKEVKDIAN